MDDYITCMRGETWISLKSLSPNFSQTSVVIRTSRCANPSPSPATGGSCVLLSSEEYRRLKRRDREVLAIEDFTEADAASVRRAEPPAESAAFNHELKP